MGLTSQQQTIHKQLQGKRVFVFDWDGTILDSMRMKALNFDQAFKAVIPKGVVSKQFCEVASHYLKLSGRPRKYIFFEIIKQFEYESEDISFEQFNAAFEALNKRNLIHANPFDDAVELLRELIKLKRKIFISSSVPQKELTDLVEAILPASIRNSIFSILGSEDGFSKGDDHLRWIIGKTGNTRDQLLVIGDDPADSELSLEAGVDCILVDRTGSMKNNRNDAISDLFLVKECL